jgi:hypothetical protein
MMMEKMPAHAALPEREDRARLIRQALEADRALGVLFGDRDFVELFTKRTFTRLA